MSKSKRFYPKAMGWIPDLPDPRDYHARHTCIENLLPKAILDPSCSVPDQIDLRRGNEEELVLAVAEDQGELNSSTAFAVHALVEYFEQNRYGRTYNGSKLFLYQVTRNTRNKGRILSADTGADLRTTLKTFLKFGMPPEEFWPYEHQRFSEEPSPYLYQLASRPPLNCFIRIDSAYETNESLWGQFVRFLSAGFPIAFGFPVPSTLDESGNIFLRKEQDAFFGGQAAVAIGYHHHHFGRSHHALLVRSSWGSQWGEDGFGWLSIDYFRHGLVRDCWTLLMPESAE